MLLAWFWWTSGNWVHCGGEEWGGGLRFGKGSRVAWGPWGRASVIKVRAEGLQNSWRDLVWSTTERRVGRGGKKSRWMGPVLNNPWLWGEVRPDLMGMGSQWFLLMKVLFYDLLEWGVKQPMVLINFVFNPSDCWQYLPFQFCVSFLITTYIYIRTLICCFM